MIKIYGMTHQIKFEDSFRDKKKARPKNIA